MPCKRRPGHRATPNSRQRNLSIEIDTPILSAASFMDNVPKSQASYKPKSHSGSFSSSTANDGRYGIERKPPLDDASRAAALSSSSQSPIPKCRRLFSPRGPRRSGIVPPAPFLFSFSTTRATTTTIDDRRSTTIDSYPPAASSHKQKQRPTLSSLYDDFPLLPRAR